MKRQQRTHVFLRPPTRISGGRCETRKTGIRRGSKHGIREYAGGRHIFCARATSGAVETAFPLSKTHFWTPLIELYPL
eukprot:7388269-Prymnesium_polylepis.1